MSEGGGGGGIGEGRGVRRCQSMGRGQIAGAGSWGINVDGVCGSAGTGYQRGVGCT